MLVVYEYNIISSINGLALEFKAVYMKIILENRRFALFGGSFEKTKKLREQIRL